jgi:hypothetical protein
MISFTEDECRFLVNAVEYLIRTNFSAVNAGTNLDELEKAMALRRSILDKLYVGK